MQEKKESLIYVLTNPSFPKNCIKIGYTQNLKQRLKSLNTGCPSNFEVYCTYKISTIANGAPDKLIHKLLIKLVPDLQIDPKKEFFILPPQDAYEILQCIAKIHNREDCLILNTNNKITIYKKNENLNANSVSNNNLSKIYYAKEAKLLSKGNSKFVLLKGSILHQWPSNKLENSVRYKKYKLKQDDLINKGLAKVLDGKLTILEDIEYNSPSAPACLVTCKEMSGLTFWKDENGKTLRENKSLNANSVSNNNLSKIYYAREAKLLSKGNGKFVLLKDSVVHRWPSDKLANNLRYQEIKSKQDDLINKGLADFINGKLTILKDIEYDSPSAPAYLVCCTNINGWVFWKDENGKTLHENERKKEI